MTCKEKIDEIEKILDDEYETKIERIREVVDDIEDKAIPLDRIKQAREEIKQNAYPIVHGVNNHDMGMTLDGIFQVLNKLIAESEN